MWSNLLTKLENNKDINTPFDNIVTSHWINDFRKPIKYIHEKEINQLYHAKRMLLDSMNNQYIHGYFD